MYFCFCVCQCCCCCHWWSPIRRTNQSVRAEDFEDWAAACVGGVLVVGLQTCRRLRLVEHRLDCRFFWVAVFLVKAVSQSVCLFVSLIFAVVAVAAATWSPRFSSLFKLSSADKREKSAIFGQCPYMCHLFYQSLVFKVFYKSNLINVWRLTK